MKIGVMGGTFNPVHIGHLILAEQVRDVERLDRVLFMPALVPPHKPAAADMASGEHRMQMVRLALAGNPFFEASDMELRRGGVSYTIDTISALRRQHPGDEFSFIIGGDSVPELASWYRVAELVNLCSFLIGERPGHAIRWEPLEKILPAATVNEMRTRVVCSVPVEVSSTDIRARIRSGRTIKYLVPQPVEDYLAEHGLYRQVG